MLSEAIIRAHLAAAIENLEGWRDPGGAFLPTEPDPTERDFVRERLKAAIFIYRRVLGEEEAGPLAPTVSTKLKPRRSTADRARQLVDALTVAKMDRDGLEALAELFLDREAGRAYDVLLRQLEQTMARGAKCPCCGRRKPRRP